MKQVKHHGYDCTKFTITVTMKDRWIPYFLAMLKHMEQLGGWGSSRDVTFYSDGDGDFRPKFEFEEGLPFDVAAVAAVVDDSGNTYWDAG